MSYTKQDSHAIRWIAMIAVLNLTSCSPCSLRSEDSIRTAILKVTPIGSPRDSVTLEVRNNYRAGFEKWSARHHPPKPNEIGPLVICTYLMSPLTSNSYYATWSFNRNQELTEVSVVSRYDGP